MGETAIQKLYTIETASTDPCRNLAIEEYLLHAVQPGECILYLWQNQHTVVIGRNQNAAAECRYEALEADGGHLVRRLSGGGAVYHDLGNLNFTFLVRRSGYDLEKQTETILQAVQSVGIHAERNGRNDLTVDGGKFSGHAYYRTGEQCYHHGTIMLDVSVAALEKYLQVSPLKLEAKGVKSVRARVSNLRQYRPDLTVQEMKAALVSAFQKVYDLPAERLDEKDLPQDAIAAGTARFADPAWRYGDIAPLPYTREARLDWGLLRVDYALEDGVIRKAAVYSDGLDADYLSAVPGLLQGCPLEETALRRALTRLEAPDPVLQGVLNLLTRK